MNIRTYEPWQALTNLQNELDRAFRGRYSGDESDVVTSHWTPAVDIREETERFVITADVPGVSAADIEVTMDNGILSLRGERREEKNVEDGSYRRTERVRGTFYRRFSLPDSADPEAISATGRDGVLEIVIPKVQKAKSRRITVSH